VLLIHEDLAEVKLAFDFTSGDEVDRSNFNESVSGKFEVVESSTSFAPKVFLILKIVAIVGITLLTM
jgi:hypothetical protein